MAGSFRVNHDQLGKNGKGMRIFITRQHWEDLCEGLRILKAGALSLFVEGAEQASLLNYKIQLVQLDHQLQDSYRDIGEKLFLKLSSQQDETTENLDLTSDEKLQQLFGTVARLEQKKKMLLEEMDELR
jgi:hypothetical protein